MDTATVKLALRFGIVACGVVLSGCAFGPLAASDKRDGQLGAVTPGSLTTASLDDGDFHSTTCNGLAIEHRERLERLATLEKQVKAEMEAAPTTISQAVMRMGPNPEKGSNSYADLAAERLKMRSNEAAAAKLNCATELAVKTQ